MNVIFIWSIIKIETYGASDQNSNMPFSAIFENFRGPFYDDVIKRNHSYFDKTLI